MEDIYTFIVDGETFEKVVQGKKDVHLRINSPKHKVYAVGNRISFVKAQEEGETEKQVQNADVESLLYFGNIMEAVETLGKERCGFKPSATFDKASDIFLAEESVESMEKYGLVALVFKNVD
ncbi:MAG: hypothetical protein IJ310_05405 [Clostridia bacterium]|nr:hypothetical protein [Clostridiales bacterium]MBQ7918228.1 hypothetical protein [Clostridia bacterium]